MLQSIDVALIRQTIAGDPGSFERLVTRYERSLTRYLRSRVDHDSDVQDLSQDIWLSAFQHLGDLKRPEQFGGWLFTIARNRCRAHFNRQRHAVEISDAHVVVVHPDDEHLRRVNRRLVINAVSSLSHILRRTVTLYYVAGYTCGEVSHRLNVPVGTVKRRLSDARKQLKTVMKNWYQIPRNGSKWRLDY